MRLERDFLFCANKPVRAVLNSANSVSLSTSPTRDSPSYVMPIVVVITTIYKKSKKIVRKYVCKLTSPLQTTIIMYYYALMLLLLGSYGHNNNSDNNIHTTSIQMIYYVYNVWRENTKNRGAVHGQFVCLLQETNKSCYLKSSNDENNNKDGKKQQRRKKNNDEYINNRNKNHGNFI